MSIWDNPEMKVGGDFIKFENVGDEVTGSVLAVGVHKWDDGSVSPQIVLDTADGEKTITAGQIRLKAALAEQRPEVGDLLTIKFTELEKRQGGKTLKHFAVTVNKNANASFNSAPMSAATPDLSHIDPAVLAALQANLGAQPVNS